MTQAQPKGASGGAGRLLPPQKNHNVAAASWKTHGCCRRGRRRVRWWRGEGGAIGLV